MKTKTQKKEKDSKMRLYTCKKTREKKKKKKSNPRSLASNESKVKTNETPKWPIGCPLWQVQSSNQQLLLKIGNTP
jgi:hypothetical protein